MAKSPNVDHEMILEFYYMFDEDDISTERLLAMVADAAGCDVDDVAEVLYFASQTNI